MGLHFRITIRKSVDMRENSGCSFEQKGASCPLLTFAASTAFWWIWYFFCHPFAILSFLTDAIQHQSTCLLSNSYSLTSNTKYWGNKDEMIRPSKAHWWVGEAVMALYKLSILVMGTGCTGIPSMLCGLGRFDPLTHASQQSKCLRWLLKDKYKVTRQR